MALLAASISPSPALCMPPRSRPLHRPQRTKRLMLTSVPPRKTAGHYLHCAAPEKVRSPAPKPPVWPSMTSENATVVWNSQGLRIDAANSSLSQILKKSPTVIGTKVEGLVLTSESSAPMAPPGPRTCWRSYSMAPATTS